MALQTLLPAQIAARNYSSAKHGCTLLLDKNVICIATNLSSTRRTHSSYPGSVWEKKQEQKQKKK
ncbi:hypothetical protein AnigIFM63326_004207, partial [Aspergillus niger]